MKGVVYYDNFNCIVNRNFDILDSIHCVRLDGAYTVSRRNNRDLDYCVDCEGNKKEGQKVSYLKRGAKARQ